MPIIIQILQQYNYAFKHPSSFFSWNRSDFVNWLIKQNRPILFSCLHFELQLLLYRFNIFPISAILCWFVLGYEVMTIYRLTVAALLLQLCQMSIDLQNRHPHTVTRLKHLVVGWCRVLIMVKLVSNIYRRNVNATRNQISWCMKKPRAGRPSSRETPASFYGTPFVSSSKKRGQRK